MMKPLLVAISFLWSLLPAASKATVFCYIHLLRGALFTPI
jgi:hypothetical protein